MNYFYLVKSFWSHTAVFCEKAKKIDHLQMAMNFPYLTVSGIFHLFFHFTSLDKLKTIFRYFDYLTFRMMLIYMTVVAFKVFLTPIKFCRKKSRSFLRKCGGQQKQILTNKECKSGLFPESAYITRQNVGSII